MMSINEACRLAKKHAKCPECGGSVTDGGKCVIDIGIKGAFFKRSCYCGWEITVSEMPGVEVPGVEVSGGEVAEHDEG